MCSVYMYVWLISYTVMYLSYAIPHRAPQNTKDHSEMLSIHPGFSQMLLQPSMTAALSTFTHSLSLSLSLSLSAIFLRAFCSLPSFLLPSCAQVSAVLAMLLPSLRRTCPTHFHFCILISSPTCTWYYRIKIKLS